MPQFLARGKQRCLFLQVAETLFRRALPGHDLLRRHRKEERALRARHDTFQESDARRCGKVADIDNRIKEKAIRNDGAVAVPCQAVAQERKASNVNTQRNDAQEACRHACACLRRARITLT